MNAFERCVHSLLEEYPVIKNSLVDAYQGVCSFWPRHDYSASDVHCSQGYFFGFHDKCPWDSSGVLLLSHKFDFRKPMPVLENEPMTIGVFLDSGLEEFRVLGETAAWNWQQGASLQWVGETQTCLYNDLEDGHPVAKVVDLSGSVKNIYPVHITSISPNGRFALAGDFSRLGQGMCGYGYRQMELLNRDRLVRTDPPHAFLLDVMTGKLIQLVELEEFVTRTLHPSDEILTFFSHQLFNQSSRRFACFYQTLHRNGSRNARLLTSSTHGGNIHCFPGSAFSHIAWLDDEHIVAYCRPPGRSYGYYLLGDCDESMVNIGGDFFVSDGHPQCSFDQRYLLADTYPDRARDQRILLYDLKERRGSLLLKMRIPFEFRYARRCDFHPRWSPDNTSMCFDSAHSGIRSICVMPLPLARRGVTVGQS